MILKKHTDNARAFTFRHEFETVDHANVTSTAILGYMVGTYEQPTIDITISKNEANNAYTMLIDYVSDILTYLNHSIVFVIALRAILRVVVKHR
ncbi:hypothetical protein [Streptococcus thermophilus]|uniref:hypothetical protein n=1 Tax=Streptococcus thermophilus TaxID=1308 RepID=UPI0015C2710E|nr:hypothetical protein [Streptococcus thermophilus]CAD0127376.1 protein of unknown function [Streptococcus thermophilus]